MPFYILSCISLLASVRVIFLPETGGENLANTIAEGEDFLLLFMARRREKLARTNDINLNQMRVDTCSTNDHNGKALAS